jgi:hypothetical protein
VRAKLTIAVLCIVLPLSTLMAGCIGQEPDVPISTPSTLSPLPTPASAASMDTSPLPTAVAPESEPPPSPGLVFPTSQPGLATVTGILDIEGGSDTRGYSLYLGEVLETSDPEQLVVGLDKAMAPQAILDVDTGAFAFYDVPPGWYALEIDRPLLVPVLIDNPEGEGTLFLTIEADDDIDLGTLPVYIP